MSPITETPKANPLTRLYIAVGIVALVGAIQWQTNFIPIRAAPTIRVWLMLFRPSPQ